MESTLAVILSNHRLAEIQENSSRGGREEGGREIEREAEMSAYLAA